MVFPAPPPFLDLDGIRVGKIIPLGGDNVFPFQSPVRLQLFIYQFNQLVLVLVVDHSVTKHSGTKGTVPHIRCAIACRLQHKPPQHARHR